MTQVGTYHAETNKLMCKIFLHHVQSVSVGNEPVCPDLVQYGQQLKDTAETILKARGTDVN